MPGRDLAGKGRRNALRKAELNIAVIGRRPEKGWGGSGTTDEILHVDVGRGLALGLERRQIQRAIQRLHIHAGDGDLAKLALDRGDDVAALAARGVYPIKPQ